MCLRGVPGWCDRRASGGPAGMRPALSGLCASQDAESRPAARGGRVLHHLDLRQANPVCGEGLRHREGGAMIERLAVAAVVAIITAEVLKPIGRQMGWSGPVA